eukprot:362563-Chlamydomonas_euryale.AAC.1
MAGEPYDMNQQGVPTRWLPTPCSQDILGVAITCAVCHLVLVQLSMGLASEDGAAHVAPSVTDV